MELLYNPDAMPEEEIKTTFVAREWLIDELIEMINGQPDGAGVQHVLLIAPRGMGKTTVLLMLQFALKDRGLSDRWQAVKFPEEAYGIYDLADFWVETLRLLSATTNDTALQSKAEGLRLEFEESDDLADAALALLKDWRHRSGRRLLLLVDNLDMILKQINDERDSARLRDVLMNDRSIMMVGCSASFFHEARSYDQPLYNFFKPYNLEILQSDHVEQLLRRRAELDGLADFGAKLETKRGRFRALEYFAGGSPRIVLMLYRVVTLSDLSDVRTGLEKLLDEVTPYYKAKVEGLAPQPRKILDIIARVTGRTGVGVTPTEIAAEARLSPNQVSAQLKRLAELGYVQPAPVRGRSTYYALSEPLYAIWHQMRFGRTARERMHWLVAILQAWYELDEMEALGQELHVRFTDCFSSGLLREARSLLDSHRYLAEALSESGRCAFDQVIRGYLDRRDHGALKSELLEGLELEQLSRETVAALAANNCITLAQAESVLANPRKSDTPNLEAEANSARLLFREFMLADRYTEAATYQRRLKDLGQLDETDWMNLIARLAFDGKTDKLLSVLEEIVAAPQAKPDFRAAVLECRGYWLSALGRYEEALESLEEAAKNGRDGARLQCSLAQAYQAVGKPEHALSAFEKSLTYNTNDAYLWTEKGGLLISLARYDDAIESLTEALRLDPNYPATLLLMGWAMIATGRIADAEGVYDRLLVLVPNDDDALTSRGFARLLLGKPAGAFEDLSLALELSAESAFVRFCLGTALMVLGRSAEALQNLDRALELDRADGPFRRFVLHFRFLLRAGESLYDLANQDWQAWVECRDQYPDWSTLGAQALTGIARTGKLEFVRDLITESGLVEQFFPLARAIEYLLSGDVSLVQTLSPEVRGVVETIVADLRPAMNTQRREPRANGADRKSVKRESMPPPSGGRRKRKATTQQNRPGHEG